MSEIPDSVPAGRPRLVSVVIPMRNEAAYIGACLDSLIGQEVSAGSFEVIVADGKSTDGSAEIVDAIAARYPHVRRIVNSEQTTPFGLNEGIRQARGEVVIILGAHAAVARDFIGENLRALDASRADAVGGTMDAIGQDEFASAVAVAISSRFGVGSVAFRQSAREGFVDTAAFAAYRREVFLKIGLFDEELVRDQDDEFNYRLRARGGRIFLTPRIRSHYVARSSAARLWRQYFGYGFWKVRVLQKHPRTMQPRHFVPALSVGAGLTLILAGLFDRRLLFAAVALAAIYAGCVVAVSVRTAAGGGWRRISRLLVIFPILHFGYGLGSLLGVLRFLPRWWIPETAPPVLRSHALDRP